MKLNHLLSTITLCAITSIGLGLTMPAQAWTAFQDKGGTMVTDPSCTAFGVNDVLCASVSTRGTLTVNHFNGISWAGFQDLGGIVVRKPNCIRWSLLGAMCAVIGTDSAVQVNRFNGATWSGFQALGGISVSDPACASAGGLGLNDAHCAIIGTDGALYVNRFDGANWLGFQKLGGSYIYNPTCTEDYTFGGVFCAAVTTGGKLDGWKYNVGVWSKMPQSANPGAAITADPNCAGIGQNKILCAVRAGGSLRVNRADNGFTWPFFQNLGGILTAAPNCTLSSPPFGAMPTAVCVVRGTNSGVFINRFDGSNWSGYQPITGANTVGAPSCTFLRNAQSLCGARGTNNHLYVTVDP